MQIKRGGGGFTLAELLIVMAIIVVLAAVAIPTFGKQLETSRETSDMEIIRNAYTLALTAAVQDGADGKFDGKFGETTAPTDDGITYPTTASDTEGAYTVEIKTAIKGGKFAQSGAVASGAVTGGKWSYVSNKLYDLEVPAVSVNVEKLTFTFTFTNGEVGLKTGENAKLFTIPTT